jgi:hypothetical protein
MAALYPEAAVACARALRQVAQNAAQWSILRRINEVETC